MNKLKIESEVVCLFNGKNGTNAKKAKLQVGNEGSSHEFDLYESDKVIGGVTTSPWKNKTGSSNTGGQDRASTELLWLSLWGGNERRVMILTDRDMADRLYERWKGCSFPKRIEIIHCNLPQKKFDMVGML